MKSFHINAYVFQADIVCCDCIAEWAEKELKEEGFSQEGVDRIVRDLPPATDVGFMAFRSESLVSKLADMWQLNYDDECSYDSDDFPKVVFADQIEGKEYCGTCHEEIS